MKNTGTYQIYLTGSRKTIRRAVFDDNGRWFVIWYKQLIEVLKGTTGYYTAEPY